MSVTHTKQSEIYESLVKKAKEWDIDPDKEVYRLCMEDIIRIIAESEIIAERKLDTITKEEIEEMIEIGRKACEYIDWSTSIETALYDYFKEQPGK